MMDEVIEYYHHSMKPELSPRILLKTDRPFLVLYLWNQLRRHQLHLAEYLALGAKKH